MNIKALIRNKGVGARIRGLMYHFLNGRISSHVSIYRQLLFSYSCMTVEEGCIIYKNSRIEGLTRYLGVEFNPEIILGARVRINQNCHITCGESIKIGDDTSLAANVTVTDINHPYEDVDMPVDDQMITTAPVEIGAACKLYNNVVILPGTKLGSHCVVGANSVVGGRFPDRCVIVGSPGRIVRLYDESKGMWVKVRPKDGISDNKGK